MAKPTKWQIQVELMRRDPAVFRGSLLMDTGYVKIPFQELMDLFQLNDFNAMDPCLKWIVGIGEQPKKTKFFIQRARGHSKTADMATSATWLLWASRSDLIGFAFAEDRDQAKLLRDAMNRIAVENPWLYDTLDYQKKSVVNKKTGASLEIMSSDQASSWGITPDFTICDEFTHWTKKGYWESIFSSAGKKAKMLAILCNAGTGYGFQWTVKQWAKKRPNWHHSAPRGAIASWLDKNEMKEQRALLSAQTFNRVWMNEWQESGQEFVTLAEAEACRDDKLSMRMKTQADGWDYVASLDFAEKNDRTVGTVVHGESDGLIRVDRMDVCCPRVRGKSTKVSWVENWMRWVNSAFGGKYGNVHFVLDKFQLLGVGQQLEELGFSIDYYDFASGMGNWKMGVILRQLIIHNRIRWYKNCGCILDPDSKRPIETAIGRDDLEIELASLIVKNYSQGRRWRFDHIDDGVHHDDRAFSLGAACQYVIENSGGFESWDLLPGGDMLAA